MSATCEGSEDTIFRYLRLGLCFDCFI